MRERWEELKAEQEGQGIFHDVPATLPALLMARKVQRRAVAVGFEYPDLAGALEDLRSELAELEEELAGREEPAPETAPDERTAEELGDLLFAAVNVARRLNVDPELELRRASARFVARVERAEQLAADSGERFAELELGEQDGISTGRRRSNEQRDRRRAGAADPRFARQPDRRGRRRLGDGSRRPRRRALGRFDRGASRPSSCATATPSAICGKGVTQGGRQRQRRDRRGGRRPRRDRPARDRRDCSIELDGTDNKARLGANAVLGVSLAAARPRPPPTEAPALPLARRRRTRTCCRCQ